MPLIAKSSGEGNYEPVPAGVHIAICYALYDLGTHYSEKFGNMAHKITLSWELPEERIEVERDGKKLNMPRAISKEYTLSLNEKANLRKDLENWRGKKFTEDELAGFDVGKIVGVPCQINVVHTQKGDKTYSNIGAIMPVPKGFKVKKPENESVYYIIDEHKRAIPPQCPEFIKKKIEASQEWAKLSGAEPPHDVGDEFPETQTGDEPAF